MSDTIITPVGRLVSGNPFEANTTDFHGKPLTDNNNQPRVEYFCGLAIAKADFGPLWQQLSAVGQAEMGQYLNHPSFAWKIADGDGKDNQGNLNSLKEGWAGCYVLRATSGYAPKVLDQIGNYLNDPASVKRGYYVRFGISCSGNKNPQYPGIYVNLQYVQLCGYGPEIQSGPDAAASVKAAPAFVLPAGASTTPIAPSGAPAMPQQGRPQGGAPQFPQPQGAPVPTQGAPAYGTAPALGAPTPSTMTYPSSVTPPGGPTAPAYDFVQGNMPQ